MVSAATLNRPRTNGGIVSDSKLKSVLFDNEGKARRRARPLKRGDKASFTISEVAKLLGWSLEQLHYCEKQGIAVPTRNECNGYRVYTLEDIHNLSIARDLRKLGFTFAQVRDYLETGNVANSIHLLNSEVNAIDQQLFELYRRRDEISTRLGCYAVAMSASESENVIARDYDERGCMVFCDREIPAREIDKTRLDYMNKNGLDISLYSAIVCYSVDTGRRSEEGGFGFDNIFMYSPKNPPYVANHVIPAGTYLTITFRGTRARSPEMLPKLRAFAVRNGYEITGEPYEFCVVDKYETTVEDEHVTRLEVSAVRAKRV